MQDYVFIGMCLATLLIIGIQDYMQYKWIKKQIDNSCLFCVDGEMYKIFDEQKAKRIVEWHDIQNKERPRRIDFHIPQEPIQILAVCKMAKGERVILSGLYDPQTDQFYFPNTIVPAFQVTHWSYWVSLPE